MHLATLGRGARGYDSFSISTPLQQEKKTRDKAAYKIILFILYFVLNVPKKKSAAEPMFLMYAGR